MVNIVIGTFILKTFIFLTRYDADHNGLPVWDSADASGMDNQASRSGEIGALQDEGVDLACYLVRELQAMSMIARALGDMGY